MSDRTPRTPQSVPVASGIPSSIAVWHDCRCTTDRFGLVGAHRVAGAREVAPHVGHGERRHEGGAALLQCLERSPIGEERVLDRIHAAPRGTDHCAAALRVRHHPAMQPTSLADDRADLVERELLDAGHGRCDLGRLRRDDLVVVVAVAGEPPHQLDHLGDAVGLVAELPAVAAGDGDGAAGRQEARDPARDPRDRISQAGCRGSGRRRPIGRVSRRRSGRRARSGLR